MSLVSAGAFLVVGVAVGWVGRSLLDPTHEGLVRAIVNGFRLRDEVRRAAAQYSESVEDIIAEGRARYEVVREQREREVGDEQPS